MPQCLDPPLSLPRFESTMSFTTSTISALQAISQDINMKESDTESSSSETDSGSESIPNGNRRRQVVLLSEGGSGVVTLSRYEIVAVKSDEWKGFGKGVPFLAIPPELHLRIMGYLNPIDSVCLSLVCSYIYNLSPPFTNPTRRFPLDIGSPSSTHPIPQPDGCKHCCPVLYSPHHCQLHYHLRKFMPGAMTYCSGKCGKFTYCEGGEASDGREYCGTCGVNYRRRYGRGRRILDVMRPGEKQIRLNKWYNDTWKT